MSGPGGRAKNKRSVTRCNRPLTGQLVGSWRRMRSLYCTTRTAILNSLMINRSRLGLGQFGMDQDLGTQRLVQHIGAAGEEQAQVIGQEAVVGGPVAGQVVLHHS